MSHLYINHHFFFEKNTLSTVFRGPCPEELKNQLDVLLSIVNPASTILDSINCDRIVFSITIDDGSKSVLDVAEILLRKKVNTVICICGNSTLGKEVLSAHMINLLRQKLGDKTLYNHLVDFFCDIDISSLPLAENVNYDQLYRYDDENTRRVKIALNYQLDECKMLEFVRFQFGKYFGSETEWAKKLYLSASDILELKESGFNIAYHGLQHRFWKSLSKEELIEEITPPESLKFLLDNPFFLSVPFGMDNSYDLDAIMQNKKSVSGIFTMGRSLKHNYNPNNNFYSLHRFDQADFFNGGSNPRERLAKSIEKIKEHLA